MKTDEEVREFADGLIAQCVRGFENEFHHRNWLRKHEVEIAELPAGCRFEVLLAHDQAGPQTGPEGATAR